MKFDSMRAWNEATALIRANGEVIAVLAGMFFFLPGFASALLMAPAPVPEAGASPEAVTKAALTWFDQVKWWFIGTAIVADFGSLAILSLLRGAARPTVGEALTQGLAGLVSLELAKLILFAGLLLAGSLVLLVGATGLTVLMPFAVAGLALAVLLISVRTCLAAPLIGVEGLRAPMQVLRRSWRLTYGNAARVLVFFVLVTLAYVVVSFILGKLIDVAVLNLAGTEAARFASAGVEALLSAVFLVLTTAMLGAVHRQLAGFAAADPAAAI